MVRFVDNLHRYVRGDALQNVVDKEKGYKGLVAGELGGVTYGSRLTALYIYSPRKDVFQRFAKWCFTHFNGFLGECVKATPTSTAWGGFFLLFAGIVLDGLRPTS